MAILRAIYRAVVIGRARSTAKNIENQLSEKQLNDIVQTKWSLIENSVAEVVQELVEADITRKNQAIPYQKTLGLWMAYKYLHFDKPV